MCDLSEYLNQNFEGEMFAVMMDNAKMHKLIVDLPYNNIQLVLLPPNTEGIQLWFIINIDFEFSFT